MNTFRLLLLLVILISTPAAACVWTYGTAIDGSEMGIDGAQTLEDAISSYLYELRTSPDRTQSIREDSAELARQLLHDSDYKLRNDYAVSLMRLGHFQRALELLQGIEREKPGLYETASNIGTVYELLGRNDSALHWISEGVRRNPDSHEGTEWLHERILQAKLALERDSSWSRHNTVLGLDFGSDSLPANPRGYPGSIIQLYDVAIAIKYQLSERLLFVKPPDPIAADLLVDLGNVLALTDVLQIAVEVYELALQYRPANPELIRRRIAALNAIIAANPPSTEPSGVHASDYGILYVVLGSIGMIGLGVGGTLGVQRIRRRRVSG